uniref:Uncharacterized protein n=1 Tax=Aegilops tauschii subsp. strangulata TaxID=200361 RepID=A0A452XZQ9_AEGTS
HRQHQTGYARRCERAAAREEMEGGVPGRRRPRVSPRSPAGTTREEEGSLCCVLSLSLSLSLLQYYTRVPYLSSDMLHGRNGCFSIFCSIYRDETCHVCSLIFGTKSTVDSLSS